MGFMMKLLECRDHSYWKKIISDSIIALDVIVMGFLLPIPVAKKERMLWVAGVNLLTTQVKDLVGSATDAFGSSSEKVFDKAHTQKGLEEIQQENCNIS